ncbi:uncharacterized protein LOC130711612 [Lotus japonicus]|uniref:uncharacterized protein LOC130711612 n=1 Tax=Lotus japonicus TaxID=34305 RepID=UPI00259007EF|nr:uncharacterized protein LOC130711612 [Lotus japonicus]
MREGRNGGYGREAPSWWQRPWSHPKRNFARRREEEQTGRRRGNSFWGSKRPSNQNLGQQRYGGARAGQWQQNGAFRNYSERGIRRDRSGRFQSHWQPSPNYQGGATKSRQQQGTRLQTRSNGTQRSNQLKESFSVFVDGLGERMTLQKLRAIFEKAGRLRHVFIQQKKKYQRRFRFGFLRYYSDVEAWKAIRMFHGMRLDGNYLVVQKAKIQRPFSSPAVPSSGTHNFEAKRKVWRPKTQQQKNEQGLPAENKVTSFQAQGVAFQSDGCQLRFAASDVDDKWVQRCARARTLLSMPVEDLQEQFSQIGLFNFRLIPLGADEVLLEFEKKEEMEETIAECGFFLEQKLYDIKPCNVFSFGIVQHVWIRLWQVPLGLWTESFFSSVGNRLGTYVMSDSATSLRHRPDFARILVRMHHPILHSFTMSVDVSGTSCIILVEKDLVAYDYGTVEVMPSTPVKIYNSEDDESYDDGSLGDVGREDGAGLLDVQNPYEKDYESAVHD